MGGYKVQGREAAAAGELRRDAEALAAAGCFALVLEGVPDLLAERVTAEVGIPTIGIRAGPACDGQVIVLHDLLGLSDRRAPKFVRRYAELGSLATEAVRQWGADVRAGRYPSESESLLSVGRTARGARSPALLAPPAQLVPPATSRSGARHPRTA